MLAPEPGPAELHAGSGSAGKSLSVHQGSKHADEQLATPFATALNPGLDAAGTRPRQLVRLSTQYSSSVHSGFVTPSDPKPFIVDAQGAPDLPMGPSAANGQANGSGTPA